MITPGEWIKDRNLILDEKMNLIATVAYTQDGYVQSNALAIHALPDLIKALQGMLVWAQRVKELNPGMEIFNAINALEKAEVK